MCQSGMFEFDDLFCFLFSAIENSWPGAGW